MDRSIVNRTIHHFVELIEIYLIFVYPQETGSVEIFQHEQQIFYR